LTPEQRIHIETNLAREVADARRARARAEKELQEIRDGLDELQAREVAAEHALAAAEQSILDAEAEREKFYHEQTLEARAEKARQQAAEAVRIAADRAKALTEEAQRIQEQAIIANEALALAITGQGGE
jgi:hypothetical protein